MEFGIVQFTSDRGLPPQVLAPLIEQAGFASYYVPSTATSRRAATPRTRAPAPRSSRRPLHAHA